MIATIMMILAMIGTCFGAESRLRDGNVEFSVANVNGETAWNKKEKEDLIDKYFLLSATSPIQVVDESPTKEELTISTSARFKNYSEFKDASNGRISDDVILLLKQKIDVAKEIGNKKREDDLSAGLSYLKKVPIKVEAGVDLSK